MAMNARVWFLFKTKQWWDQSINVLGDTLTVIMHGYHQGATSNILNTSYLGFTTYKSSLFSISITWVYGSITYLMQYMVVLPT